MHERQIEHLVVLDRQRVPVGSLHLADLPPPVEDEASAISEDRGSPTTQDRGSPPTANSASPPTQDEASPPTKEGAMP
jgi:hypothetical protein